MDKDTLIAIVLPDGRVYDITDSEAAAEAAVRYLEDGYHPIRLEEPLFPGAAKKLLAGEKAWWVVFTQPQWDDRFTVRFKSIMGYYGTRSGWDGYEYEVRVRVWAKDEASAIEKAKQMLRNDGFRIDETEEEDTTEAGGQAET